MLNAPARAARKAVTNAGDNSGEDASPTATRVMGSDRAKMITATRPSDSPRRLSAGPLSAASIPLHSFKRAYRPRHIHIPRQEKECPRRANITLPAFRPTSPCPPTPGSHPRHAAHQTAAHSRYQPAGALWKTAPEAWGQPARYL